MNKAEERYREIIETLKNNSIVTVTEFAKQLSVSPETIRKDLSTLAEQGVIVRIHGGAALSNERMVSIPFQFRETVHKEEKRELARAACDFIEPGDSLIVESSTTMVELVKVLLETPDLLKTLVIVTNSFHIMTLLEMGKLCARTFFLGGWMNAEEQATQGQLTVEELKGFHVDKCLLSGAALGKNLILSSYYEDDMRFQKQAVKSSARSILLLESGKYPSAAVLSVAPVESFDDLVTNIEFGKSDLEKLKNSKMNLHYICTSKQNIFENKTK